MTVLVGEIGSERLWTVRLPQLRYEGGIRKDSAGYELIGQPQQFGVKAPVILSTAYPNKEEAHNLGFYDAATTQPGIFELVMKAIQGG